MSKRQLGIGVLVSFWRICWHTDGVCSFGHDGGGVLIHGDVGVLILVGGVSWWPVVRRWEPSGGKRLKCSALIFENKQEHSPALEHAAGTSTQIIWIFRYLRYSAHHFQAQILIFWYLRNSLSAQQPSNIALCLMENVELEHVLWCICFLLLEIFPVPAA